MKEKELVIIGGGPSGLKAGELATEMDLDYVILEKGEIVQSWRSMPKKMKLLSPCHPQRDWTSLSGRFPIWKFDVDRPYCTAKQFVEYADAFAEKFNLNIKTHFPVKHVKKDGNEFLIAGKNELIKSKLVFIVTGLFSSPFIPKVPGISGNPSVSHSSVYKGPKDFLRKRVIIIGGGNSAAEISIDLCGYSQVYLFSRRPLKYFSKTKNLNNIRGISESFLKELIQMGLIRHKNNMKMEKVENNTIYFKNGENYTFDNLILATGFIPRVKSIQIDGLTEIELNKLPETTKFGESVKLDNLFFGGPLLRFKTENTFIHSLIKSIPVTMKEIKNRLGK